MKIRKMFNLFLQKVINKFLKRNKREYKEK